jgi:phage gp36-like protein
MPLIVEIAGQPATGPYATSQRYLQRYGVAEAAQLLADEERLLTDTLLRDALNVKAGLGTWSNNPTGPEQAAALNAVDRLERQLLLSTNLIDGYISKRVALPLAATTTAATTLEDCCLALARCGLADDADNATERMDSCCKQWRQWLVDVANGRVELVAGPAAPEPSQPTTTGRSVRSGQAASGYDWTRFGGL